MTIQEFEPLSLGEKVVCRDQLIRHLITRSRCDIVTILARKEDPHGWFYSVDRCETWLPHIDLVRVEDLGSYTQELSQQIADKVAQMKATPCES